MKMFLALMAGLAGALSVLGFYDGNIRVGLAWAACLNWIGVATFLWFFPNGKRP